MPKDELIAALEKATGPDRELDAAIWRWRLGDTTGDHWFSDGHGNVTKDDQAPSFTASIDAALTLVPERAVTAVAKQERWRKPAWMWAINDEMGVTHFGHAPTPALAICLAALRATERGEAGR